MGSRPETSSSSPSSRLSFKKKILFSAVTLCLSLVVSEIACRVAGIGAPGPYEDPFVQFELSLSVFQEGPDGVMRTRPGKLTWFNQQSFRDPKPAGTRRVFCLGGSTTYGRPYNAGTAYPAWLQEYLNAGSHRQRETWEVINAGGISYASYRIVKVLEETLNYDPDVIVIYTGHNEFLEERSYGDLKKLPPVLRESNRRLSRSHLYRGVKSLWRARQQNGEHPQSTSSKRPLLSAEVRARMDNSIGPEDYHRDDVWAQGVLRHFEFNLRRMAELCRTAEVPLVLVVPASNLRDFSPFKNEFARSVTTEEQQALRNQLDEARTALQDGNAAAAVPVLKQALNCEPRYPEIHYLLGKACLATNRPQEARQSFIASRDEDVCPLRAPTPFLEAVRQVASDYNIPLIDYPRLLQSKSEAGIPGNDWFLDHVHPTIEGHGLLAEAILKQAPFEMNPTKAETEAVQRSIFSRVDEELQGRALLNLSKVLGWAGQSAESDRLARQAVELVENDAEACYLAGIASFRAGEYSGARNLFERARGLAAQNGMGYYGLGVIHEQEGDSQTALKFYRQAVQREPDNAQFQFQLAELENSAGDLESALDHYLSAILIRPNFVEAHFAVGVIHAKSGRYNNARKSFQRVRELKGDHPELLFYLGQVEEAAGHFEAARAYYHHASQMDPTHESSIQALERVSKKCCR